MLKGLQLQKERNATKKQKVQQGSTFSRQRWQKVAQVILGSILFGFLSFKPLLAQDGSGLGALFGGMILFYLLIFAVVIGVYIWMLVWVNNDAKQRGQSGCLPMALVFLFGPIGLIIWLLMRDSK